MKFRMLFLFALVMLPMSGVVAKQDEPAFQDPVWEYPYEGEWPYDQTGQFHYRGGPNVLLILGTGMGGYYSQVIEIETGIILDQRDDRPIEVQDGFVFYTRDRIEFFDNTLTSHFSIPRMGTSNDPNGDIPGKGVEWIGDTVYIAISDSSRGGSGIRGLRAVNLYTGEERWRVVYDHPIRWVVGDHDVLIISEGLFTGLNLETGSSVWSVPSSHAQEYGQYVWMSESWMVFNIVDFWTFTASVIDQSSGKAWVVMTLDEGSEYDWWHYQNGETTILVEKTGEYRTFESLTGVETCRGTLPAYSKYSFHAEDKWLTIAEDQLVISDRRTCDTSLKLDFPSTMLPLAMTMLNDNQIMVLWGERVSARNATLTLMQVGTAGQVCGGIREDVVPDVTKTLSGTAYVSAETTTLRVAASTDSAEVAVLSYCDTVDINPQDNGAFVQGDWIWIETEYGAVGWVQTTELRAVREDEGD